MGNPYQKDTRFVGKINKIAPQSGILPRFDICGMRFLELCDMLNAKRKKGVRRRLAGCDLRKVYANCKKGFEREI